MNGYIKVSKCRRQIITSFIYFGVSSVLFLLSNGVLFSEIAGKTNVINYYIPLFSLIILMYLLIDIKIESIKILSGLRMMTILMCVFLLYVQVEVLTGGHAFKLMVSNPIAALLAMFILLIIWLFFFSITGNTLSGLRLLTVVVAMYGYVSYFVFAFRGTPFIPVDFLRISAAFDLLRSDVLALSHDVVSATFIFMSIFVVTYKANKLPIEHRTLWKTRCISFGVSVCLMFFVTSSVFIKHLPFEPDYWNQTISAHANGSIVNFIVNIDPLRSRMPDGYSQQKLESIVKGYVSDAVSDASVYPDVILIMGESWVDITYGGSVETNSPIMPFITSLGNHPNGVYSKLLSTTEVGATSLAEFQVLTGTHTSFGLHATPYLVHGIESVPSIVDSFKRMGYQTTAMHTGTRDAWGREKAFATMGFDQFFDEADLTTDQSEYIRSYLSDSAMYDKALMLLDGTDTPQFIYAITSQTQGVYDDESYQSSVSLMGDHHGYLKTEQYLGLLNESDQSLQQLIKGLEMRQRPTVVVAFGDHIPAVEDEYMNNIGSTQGELWPYQTFFAMWSNVPLKQDKFMNSTDIIGMNNLGAYMMYRAGLPMTGYQKYLLDVAKSVPAISVDGYLKSNGTFIRGLEDDFINDLRMLQYNMLYDRSNRVPDFFYLQSIGD